MKVCNISKILAALALCIFTVGFAKNASASYCVRVDCHGTGGLPDWAGTGDQLVIKSKINGTWATVWAGFISNAGCQSAGDDGYLFCKSGFTWSDVQALRVSIQGDDEYDWIDGDDCFWIDDIHVTDGGGVSHIYWGVDNNTGYCVSDETDSSQYCLDGHAYSYWTFNV